MWQWSLGQGILRQSVTFQRYADHISFFLTFISENVVLLFNNQALFLRTSWAESETLRQLNLVFDCEQEGGGCCDKGCISIFNVEPEDSIEEEAESDNE